MTKAPGTRPQDYRGRYCDGTSDATHRASIDHGSNRLTVQCGGLSQQPSSQSRSCRRRLPADRRADLLRHDHQPRRRTRPGNPPPSRDPRRYGSGHLVSRSIRRAIPLILEAVGQVRARAVPLRDARHEHLPPPIGLLREFCDGSRWVKGPGRAGCAGM